MVFSYHRDHANECLEERVVGLLSIAGVSWGRFGREFGRVPEGKGNSHSAKRSWVSSNRNAVGGLGRRVDEPEDLWRSSDVAA